MESTNLIYMIRDGGKLSLLDVHLIVTDNARKVHEYTFEDNKEATKMIIDVSNTLPQIYFDEVNQIENTDKELINYQLPNLAALAGWTKEYLAFKIKENNNEAHSLIEELLQNLRSTYSFDNFKILLDERKIKYHAIHLSDSFEDMTEEATKHAQISRILKVNPHAFFGLAAFNPHQGSKSMRIVRNAITMQGFKGVTINPSNHGIPADHRKYYPIYSLCEEYHIPIWVQSSLNYSANSSGYIAHPNKLEKPLLDFPNLKIIAGHGGWPWIDEVVTMLLKYKNLYVDTSAFTANTVLKNSTGWSVFLSYVNNRIQQQIVFGSEWLKLGQPLENCIAEIESWPLDERTKEKIYWENAADLFKLQMDDVKKK